MTSIRPVPYDAIMGIQIFPSQAGRVVYYGPARGFTHNDGNSSHAQWAVKLFSPPVFCALAQPPANFAGMANQLPPFQGNDPRFSPASRLRTAYYQ